MAELPKVIHNERTGLTYNLHGDYYLPDLGVVPDPRPIGKYGGMRLDYLKEHRPSIYAQLLLGGVLEKHLADVNEQVQEYLDRLIPQMAAAEGVTEHMKEVNQLGWVARMNNIRARAEEVVCSEIIYG